MALLAIYVDREVSAPALNDSTATVLQSGELLHDHLTGVGI